MVSSKLLQNCLNIRLKLYFVVNKKYHLIKYIYIYIYYLFNNQYQLLTQVETVNKQPSRISIIHQKKKKKTSRIQI